MSNWYVDAVGGVDTNAGTSAGAPVQNIQKALDLAGAADVGVAAVVFVKPGTYTEELGGASYNYLNIKAIGTHKYTSLSLLACDATWTPTTNPAGVILATGHAQLCINNNWHHSPGNGFLIRGFTISPTGLGTPDGGTFLWSGNATTGDWNCTIDHCVVNNVATQTSYGMFSSVAFTNPTRTLTITNCSGAAASPGKLGCYVSSFAAVTYTNNNFLGYASSASDDQAIAILGDSAPASGSMTVIATGNTWTGGSFFYAAANQKTCPMYLTAIGNTINCYGPMGVWYYGYQKAQGGSRFIVNNNTITMHNNGNAMVSAIEIGANSGYNKYPFAVTQIIGNTIRVRGSGDTSDHGINIQDRCVGAEIAYNDIQPSTDSDKVFEYGINCLASRANVHHNVSVAAVPLVSYMSKDSHFHHNTLRVGGYLTGSVSGNSALDIVYGPILAENCRFTDNIIDGSQGVWALRILATDGLTIAERANCTFVSVGSRGASDNNIAKFTDAGGTGWANVLDVSSGTSGSAAILSPGTADEIRGIVWEVSGNDLYVMFDTPLSVLLPAVGATGLTIHCQGPSHTTMNGGYRNNLFDRNVYRAGSSGLASIPTGTGSSAATCATLAELQSAWLVWGLSTNDAQSVEGDPAFLNVTGTPPWDLRAARNGTAKGTAATMWTHKGAWQPRPKVIRIL